MGRLHYILAASLLVVRTSLSFSSSLWVFWRQRLALFMTKLPVAYIVSDTWVVGREEQRKEDLASKLCCSNDWLWTLHKFFHLPRHHFPPVWNEDKMYCIVMSYVKNAEGYINSRGYFASNNEYNNHLRIKLDIINTEN